MTKKVGILLRTKNSSIDFVTDQPEEPKLVEGIDYYIDDSGLLVFTADYLLKRGFCCEQGCRHCPYSKEGE